MTRTRALILCWIGVLALASLLPLSAVFRGIVHVGPQPQVITGKLHQPIVAIGADVVLQKGTSEPVVVIGGSIQAHGDIANDLVAIGGQVYLFKGVTASGDVLSLVGGIYRAPGVRAEGRLGGALHRWDGQLRRHHPDVGNALALNMRLGLAAGLALLLVGTCLTIVFPWQVVLIASTLRTSPLKSVASGVLSALIFMFLVVPLGLSLAGLPFAILLTGAATLAWLFGFTACAVVTGRMLARGSTSLLWATAAGLVVFALALTIPLVGALTVAALGLVGAGALAVALLGRAQPSVPMT